MGCTIACNGALAHWHACVNLFINFNMMTVYFTWQALCKWMHTTIIVLFTMVLTYDVHSMISLRYSVVMVDLCGNSLV